jgi:hypothetical protein
MAVKILDVEVKFKLSHEPDYYVKWIGGENLLLCKKDQIIYIPLEQNMLSVLSLKENLIIILETLVKYSEVLKK